MISDLLAKIVLIILLQHTRRIWLTDWLAMTIAEDLLDQLGHWTMRRLLIEGIISRPAGIIAH